MLGAISHPAATTSAAAGLIAQAAKEVLNASGLRVGGGERTGGCAVQHPSQLIRSETSANTDRGYYTIQSASTVVPLNAGDTIELFASQDSGIALPLDRGDDRTYLTLTSRAVSRSRR